MEPKVDLTVAEHDLSAEFSNDFIQCQLNCNVILHPGKLWPCSSLTCKRTLQHVLRGRVAQYFREVSVGYRGENGDVARVSLIEYRSCFSQVVRKYP